MRVLYCIGIGIVRVLGAAMFSILLLLPTHQGIFYIMEFLCCEIYEPFFHASNISFTVRLIITPDSLRTKLSVTEEN